MEGFHPGPTEQKSIVFDWQVLVAYHFPFVVMVQMFEVVIDSITACFVLWVRSFPPSIRRRVV